MARSQSNLLHTSQFLPLFITQFLGAFNDNIYKNALVILITYSIASAAQMNPAILITLAAGIFILPFFLFSAIAGQLADKFEKSTLIRYTKIAEIVLAIAASIGFYLQNISLLMTVLFFLGAQATFFGPMKYSILPDALPTEQLVAANALLEAGTFLAILLGTITGGALATFHAGPALVSIIVITIAIIGFLTSLRIPVVKAASPNMVIHFNPVTETINIIQYAMKNQKVALSILGISWFWLVGATYLSQFPTYAKDILSADSSVVTVFLAFFTLGIGIGSLACNQLLKGRISATYVPLAALGMTLFSIDLVLASHHVVTKTGNLLGLTEFLSYLNNWRILLDLLLLAICGGVYTVPLYAILQHASSDTHRSRVIACNNIMNALFMVAAAMVTSLMLCFHFSVTHIFMLVAIVNLVAAIYLRKLGMMDALG